MPYMPISWGGLRGQSHGVYGDGHGREDHEFYLPVTGLRRWFFDVLCRNGPGV